MKILITADIHDNQPNLEMCLNYYNKNKVDGLVVCGDITNEETLDFIAKNFPGEIFVIRGNMDIYDENLIYNYKNIKYVGRYGTVNISGKKVGLCHEPDYADSLLKDNLADPCEIIFFGHTHKPWQEEKNNIRLINPGTVAGTFSKPTFAVWDTENNDLKLILIEDLWRSF